MEKSERVEAALRGASLDRVPFSFWTHFPDVDMDPVRLAEKTYQFYKEYDLDFIKTMNNGMYPIEGYDCRIDYSQIKHGGAAKLIQGPISKPDDWRKINTLDIRSGALERELYSLKLVIDKLGTNAPVVMTVFSPMTVASKLSKNRVIEHIQNGETAHLHKALEVLADNTARLSEKAIEIGASGVFFASQLSRRNYLSESQYQEVGVPYDLKALHGASKGWFNILHLHGDQIMFSLLKDYPVQCLNWHVWETAPDFSKARAETDKCFMGGIVRSNITESNLEGINRDIDLSCKQLQACKHIITPGCVIRHPVNPDMLRYTSTVIKERLTKGGEL